MSNSKVVNENYAIGDLYITTIKHESGEAIAAQKGYGKWERYGEGRALIGVSSNNEQPEWTKENGNTFGNYEHSLSTSELPADGFKVRVAGYNGSREHQPGGLGYASGRVGELASVDSNESGWHGESFYLTQPSIVIGVWVRTE